MFGDSEGMFRFAVDRRFEVVSRVEEEEENCGFLGGARGEKLMLSIAGLNDSISSIVRSRSVISRLRMSASEKWRLFTLDITGEDTRTSSTTRFFSNARVISISYARS